MTRWQQVLLRGQCQYLREVPYTGLNMLPDSLPVPLRHGR